MTLSLTVDEQAWEAHVRRHVDTLGSRLIPVVKGNGYGFGRRLLAERIPALTGLVAVGTIFETSDVTDLAERVLVLTPSFDDHLDGVAANVTLTVGSPAQARHLVAVGWRGPVVVKVASAMLRHGIDPSAIAGAELDDLNVVGYAIHPPIAGTSADHLADIERAVAGLPSNAEVQVSHLGIDDFLRLADARPQRPWKLRLGTALWHGDKSTMRLQADVLDIRRVTAGTQAGYRLTPTPADGHLVIIGAGSAQGVVPLADVRSPFHFARRRLSLLEPPHMHTSMVFVANGEPCPGIGEVVDVQRPLISVTPDRIVWTS